VTTETGIRRLVPAADIDDYVFEPCGYSMNGILGGGFITIHITPEEVREGGSCCCVGCSAADVISFHMKCDAMQAMLSLLLRLESEQ
jgi:ornithine decarboxylase/S-adenosylmethionine decarboxylase